MYVLIENNQVGFYNLCPSLNYVRRIVLYYIYIYFFYIGRLWLARIFYNFLCIALTCEFWGRWGRCSLTHHHPSLLLPFSLWCLLYKHHGKCTYTRLLYRRALRFPHVNIYTYSYPGIGGGGRRPRAWQLISTPTAHPLVFLFRVLLVPCMVHALQKNDIFYLETLFKYQRRARLPIRRGAIKSSYLKWRFKCHVLLRRN